MSSSVWAITGFSLETFRHSASEEKVAPDRVIGRLSGTTHTIMHGMGYGNLHKPQGYVYLKVSLQKLEEFENLPLAERGMGAVCGGFISSDVIGPKGNARVEQEWGDIDASETHHVCGFHHATGNMYANVRVCFGQTNAAAVSGFWSNGKVVVGPETECDKTDWGVNLCSSPGPGNNALVLEKVESTVVMKVDFPELLEDGDGGVKTFEPEVVFSELFTNASLASFKDTFDTNTTLLDTHTFVFEEGLEVDWSTEWKAAVPLLSEAKTTTTVEVSFGAHQSSATSKRRSLDRAAEVTLPPMSGCKATARYTKGVLAVNAVLTVQKTFTNGAIQAWKVPAKYTGVSYHKTETKLESIPAVPPT